VVAPENANNAVIGTSHAPMLLLGIPGDAVTAVILGALLLHGFQPGPQFLTKSPGAFTDIVGIGLLSAVAMLIIGIIATPYLSKIITVPSGILMPIIGLISIVGAFSISGRLFDTWVMIAF